MRTTVRRNATKKINGLIDNAKSVKYFTLSNCFAGVEEAINKENLLEDIKDARSLSLKDDGTLVISVHSNYWVEVLK